MPLGGYGRARANTSPPGFTPNRRPVMYPGLSAGPDLQKNEMGLPSSIPSRAEPLAPLDPSMRRSLIALCEAIAEEGCADIFFKKLRRELRSAHTRASPPNWQEPPFGAFAILDTNTSEVAVPVGGAFTELIGFTVPNRMKAVVYAVGADVVPVGLDEENLIGFRILVNGVPPAANITGSTGGGTFNNTREWIGSIANPGILRPPILLRENESFSFQAADNDASAPADVRGIVRGWFFTPADPTGEGYYGWMGD